MLDPVIRPHTGVNFTNIFKEKFETASGAIQEVVWERVMVGIWERMMMGFPPSPYMFTTDLLEVECLIRGGRRDLKHFFQWFKVVLNLPGMNEYQPSRP